MSCKHCINDAKPDGKDMSIDTLEKCLNFIKNHNIGKILVITGGEPTEHRSFNEVMMHILDWQTRNQQYLYHVTITTNGEKIQQEPQVYYDYVEMFRNAGICLVFQVSADVKYYPRRIETHRRIFREAGFVLYDDCVEQIYPQGRALTNNIPWKSKASKCYNVRALSKQLPNCTLCDIEAYLAMSNKFCTPHIGIDGSIKLGESDLCPACASIEDTEYEIIDKIRRFKCHQCDHINDNLSDMYKQFL